MALLETLFDNFDDNSIDISKWNGDSVTETGGRLQIAANTSSGDYNAIASVATDYELTGSYVHVELVDAGNLSVNTMEFYLEVYTGDSDYIYWALEYGTGELVAYVWDANDGSPTELYRVAYNSTTHRWLRIRESGGSIYFDTSTDGLSWTNRATTTVAFSVNDLQVDCAVLNPSSGSTTVIIDNFNITPTPPPSFNSAIARRRLLI